MATKSFCDRCKAEINSPQHASAWIQGSPFGFQDKKGFSVDIDSCNYHLVGKAGACDLCLRCTLEILRTGQYIGTYTQQGQAILLELEKRQLAEKLSR